MTPEQFEKIMQRIDLRIDTGVKEAIEIHVNGKVRGFGEKLDKYIEEDVKWKDKDKEWKGKADPAVLMGTNVITFWGVFKWIIAFGTTIAGGIMAIRVIREFFK